MKDVPAAALDRLPIFPLPGAVLLPGGLLPLHIFEPRYRDMTRDALAGHGLIAMAQPLEPESAESVDPAVGAFMGVGRIIASEELDDGRYFIVLRGVGRVQMVREVETDALYRTILARPVADSSEGDPQRLREAETALRTLADSVAGALPEGGQLLRQAIASETTAGGLADLLGSTLVGDPADRQALLETTEVQARLDIMSDHVAALAAELIGQDQVN